MSKPELLSPVKKKEIKKRWKKVRCTFFEIISKDYAIGCFTFYHIYYFFGFSPASVVLIFLFSYSVLYFWFTRRMEQALQRIHTQYKEVRESRQPNSKVTDHDEFIKICDKELNNKLIPITNYWKQYVAIVYAPFLLFAVVGGSFTSRGFLGTVYDIIFEVITGNLSDNTSYHRLFIIVFGIFPYYYIARYIEKNFYLDFLPF